MVRSAEQWQEFNVRVIAEFRQKGGQVDRFGQLPLMILHTIGARSGLVREVPLIPVERGSDVLFYATAEGSPTDPAWVHNLRAQPQIMVEDGASKFEAVLEELPSTEASTIVTTHAVDNPQLASYLESAAPRSIPVFRMQRVRSEPRPGDRASE